MSVAQAAVAVEGIRELSFSAINPIIRTDIQQALALLFAMSVRQLNYWNLYEFHY